MNENNIPPDNVLIDADFSALPEPFQGLAQKLQDAINNEVDTPKGDIKLTTDLLGGFSIFTALYGLDSLTVITIKDAQLQIVGEAGVDLTSADAAGKIGLKLAGTSSIFGEDLVRITALFFLDSSGEPIGLTKLTPPPSASPSWGIGTAFPDVPIVNAIKFDSPAMVLSSDAAEDDELNFGVDKGFNFYGDVGVKESSDEMINFIGGIFGVDKINSHAAIIKTNAGPKYLLESRIDQDVTIIPGNVFNMKFMGSGIALEIIAGEPSISIDNNIALTLTWIGAENLYFTGIIKVEPESITGSFTLNKAGSGGQEWRNPFGIPGLIIRQLAIQLGLTYLAPWIDNIGIAGNMKIGTIDGSIAVLVDANDPDQFVLAGQTPEITLAEVMSAMSPATFIAYQAVPASVRDVINKVVDVKLTGIDEEGVKLSIVPVATKIGALEFNDEGITFIGKLVAWGWSAQAHINVSDSNILVDASMDAINLANVFRVTGAAGEPNPRLYLQVSTTTSPELYVSSKIYLLGISRELQIQATTNGLEFYLSDRIGNILVLDQTCILNENRLATSGSINFTLNLNVGPIKVAGITVVNRIKLVDVGFNAGAAMEITIAPSFSMTISGSFRFYGQSLSMPTLALNVAPSDFQGVYDAVQSQITNRASEIFGDLFKTGLEWAKAVGEEFIEFGGDAANVLKNAFNETASATANIMKNTMGKGIDEIAGGLKSAYNFSSNVTAQVLKDTGYAANEVANSLKFAYGISAQAAAEALKYAGYAANEVANSLKFAYGISAQAAAEALKHAGYAANEVANSLKFAYGISAEAAAAALKYAGYGMNEIGNAVTDVYNLSAQGVATALKYAGYGVDEVGNFMKNVAGYAGDAVDSALKGAGYAANEVGKFMGDVFGGKWIPHVDIIPHIDHIDLGKY